MITHHLPPGSRVWQAELDDRMFTTDQYIALSHLDALDYLLWMTANKGVEASKQSQRPKPRPRPADLRKQQRMRAPTSDIAEIASYATELERRRQALRESSQKE